MKKRISIFLLMFACVALVFTGCGGSSYLITTTTKLSPSSFYNNYYCGGLTCFDGVASDSTIITSTFDQITYENHVKPNYQVLPEERCLISVLDFLCAVNASEEDKRLDDKTTVKLYEYSVILGEEFAVGTSGAVELDPMFTKAVVLVKSSNNNADFATYLFYMSKNDVCEVASLLTNLSEADYNFTFKQTKYNIQTKTYTLTYGTNLATVSFNNAKSCLNYEISTHLGGASYITKIKKSVYKYANGDIGIRILTTEMKGAANVTIIYEQLTKDFYKRAKIGTVKDDSLILSLEAIQEDMLGKVNHSDGVGFALENALLDNSDSSKITCILYGTNN